VTDGAGLLGLDHGLLEIDVLAKLAFDPEGRAGYIRYFPSTAGLPDAAAGIWEEGLEGFCDLTFKACSLGAGITPDLGGISCGGHVGSVEAGIVEFA
jgi:hypothetical protein